MVTGTATSAVQAWKERIEAHDEQSRRARGEQPEGGDFWSTLAAGFRADPRRTDDPVVNLLAQWVTEETTVLDVGGGAGRYALPLALLCRSMTVVEPSPAMVGQLEEAARDAEISNVSVVKAGWEEAEVEPHDLVLCANIVYGVKEIGTWVSKLNDHARERVVIVAWMDAPPLISSPLWKAVHGEERIELPALPELLRVLWEMDIFPNIEMLPEATPRRAPNMDAAIGIARLMLHVQAGTEKDERLQEVARELVVETPEGVTLRGNRPRPQGVLWWRTEGALGAGRSG